MILKVNFDYLNLEDLRKISDNRDFDALQKYSISNIFEKGSIAVIQAFVKTSIKLDNTNDKVFSTAILEKYFATFGDTPFYSFMLAKLNFIKGDYQGSLKLYTRLSNEHTNKPEYLVLKGQCHALLNEFEQAFSTWKTVLNKVPTKLIIQYINNIDDDEVLVLFLKRLAFEPFNKINGTPLAQLMYKLYRGDKDKYVAFKKHIESIKQVVNDYTLASLGLLPSLEGDFIKTIIETDNKNIILKVFSGAKVHRKNMLELEKSGLIENIKCNILKSAYNNFFNRKYLPDSASSRKKKKRLKIAICISGQLRGYENAFKTWNEFDFLKHDVQYFICVWQGVGRKSFHKNHLNRIFTVNVARELRNYLLSNSAESFFNLLPKLNAYLKQNNKISSETLSHHYKTKHVQVLDDDHYVTYSNAEKMYMMVNKCWEMIRRPEDYDLIIRIRPDRCLDKFELNIQQLATKKFEECVVSDKIPNIHMGNVFMGDQFAIGSSNVMSHYSRTYAKCISQEGAFSANDYRKLIPHTSFYANLLHEGFQVIDHENKIAFGEYSDCPKVNPEDLLTIIKEHDQLLNPFLASLMEACKADIKSGF